MQFTRRSFIAASAAATGLAFAGRQAGAAVTLRYAHVQPESHVTNKAAMWMAEQIAKRSGGRVEMRVFHSGTLGGPNQMLDSLQAGDLDFAWISSAPLAVSIKEFNIFSLSYLLADFPHFEAALVKKGPVLQRLQTIVEKSPYDVEMVGVYGGVSRHLYNNRRAVNDPADLSGLKVRVQPSELEAKIWAALGAAPQQLQWSEIYTGLQTGVINAAESSIDAYFQNRFNEVAPHFAFTNHQYLVLPVLMGKRVARKVSKDDLNMLREVSAEAAQLCVRMYRESEEKLVADAQSRNVQLSRPDTASFQKLVAPLVRSEAARFGATDLLDLIEKARA